MAKSTPLRAGTALPVADARNHAGGLAYSLEARHALAQLAATGTLRSSHSGGFAARFDTLKRLAAEVDDEYLAKLAVYARERGAMKDASAALVVLLAARKSPVFQKTFDRVVDNGRVLRTVFELVRSGALGRRSLSSALQRAFQRWLNSAPVGALLSASIGSKPSLRDVLRLARPTPTSDERRALFGWLTDKPEAKWSPATRADLPQQVVLLETFRAAKSDEEQMVLLDALKARWDLLADAARGPRVWSALARGMGPQALRMNLNTLLRHGVFGETGGKRAERRADSTGEAETMIDLVAGRLSDRDEIRRSRQMPYQFFTAALHADAALPEKIKRALATAAELACDNAPTFGGPVVIGLDVSGSMRSPVTGSLKGRSTKMRCVDVAALIAAAVVRKNPESVVIPFDTRAYDAEVAVDEPITTLARRLASYGGGGTDCSAPIEHALARHANRSFAGVVLVSDNESWVGTGSHGSTAVLTAWRRFAANQARLRPAELDGPKLVCVDLAPHGTTQAAEASDVLNVGGFSDAVFDLIANFLDDDAARFVAEVEAIEL